MEIKNIVLHHIKREENQAPVLNISDHLLEKDNIIVEEFVEKLIKSFSSKNPTYGTFQEDKLAYPFQKLVETYRTDNEFLDFSIESMKLLEKEIQVPQAKGGYVVFIHYLQNGIDFLITIMLDKAEQFTINDDNLDIKKLKTLDIDKLARANRVNINKWEDKLDLYLAFIKGTRDVSSYFQKFIGNTDLTSSKKNSQNLKEAISKYMRNYNFDDETKEKVNQQISEYIKTQYESNSDIELTAISAHLNQAQPNNFIEFIRNTDDIEVSGNFRLSRKADFNVFHRAKFSGNGFKLEFEKNLIKQGKILRDGNDIIIKDLPQDILDNQFEI
ncbi:nucleoid-associated protein [Winogradskyella vidalii]|uniref:nucleoid-associated protein n=1 Tax=Winogradskyella vidalii TaxID=2615024 RepID=UPI0015CB01A3|nr:nucleoid-associated protein [Winogradskyella vidalii]